MSVINQVLNQLERRGRQTDSEQTMVRAVPLESRRLAKHLLELGLASILALAGGIAAWQWIQMRKPVAVSAIQHQPVLPVSAVPAAPTAAASVDLSGKTMLAEIISPALPPVIESPKIQPLVTGQKLLKRSSPAPGAETPTDNRNTLNVQAAVEASSGVSRARPASTALPVQTAISASSGVSIIKQISPAQLADAEFRKAVELMQRGHISDAMAGYEAALRLDANHDAARQAWAVLLLENGRGAEAERVLQDGLKNRPEHTVFAMLLARLQVEHGAVEEALETLKASLRYADSQADYQAFFAALLQRQNRHDEAITHYQNALRLAPANGVWLMGYGISLQAAQRNSDARDAYQRALESRMLSPELQEFVRKKIKEP